MSGYDTARVNAGAYRNPVSELSNSLLSLSKQYSDQSDRKAARDLQNSNDEATSAYRASVAKATSDRFNVLQEEKKKALQNKEAERKVLSNFSTNYSEDTYKAKKLSNDKELLNVIQNAKENAKEILARNVLSNNRISPTLGRFDEKGIALDKNGNRVNITDSDFNNSASYIDKAYKDGYISPKDYESFNTDVKNYNNKIDLYALQNIPVYKNEAASSISRQLVSNGADTKEALSLASILTLGLNSKDTLTSRAKAYSSQQQKVNDSIAKAAYRAYTIAGKNGKNKYTYANATPKSKWVSTAEVRKYIDSNFDGSSDLLDYYNYAVGVKKLDRNIAKEALGDFYKGSFLSKVKGTKEEFATFVDSLTKLSRNKSNGTNVNNLMSLLTPKVAPIVDPIKQNRLAYLGGFKQIKVELLNSYAKKHNPKLEMVDKSSTKLDKSNPRLDRSILNSSNSNTVVQEPAVMVGNANSTDNSYTPDSNMLSNGKFNPSRAAILEAVDKTATTDFTKQLLSKGTIDRISSMPKDLQGYATKKAMQKSISAKTKKLDTALRKNYRYTPDKIDAEKEALKTLLVPKVFYSPKEVGLYRDNDPVVVATAKALGINTSLVSAKDVRAYLATKEGKSLSNRLNTDNANTITKYNNERQRILDRMNLLKTIK